MIENKEGKGNWFVVLCKKYCEVCLLETSQLKKSQHMWEMMLCWIDVNDKTITADVYS